jgi:hypothetical protein
MPPRLKTFQLRPVPGEVQTACCAGVLFSLLACDSFAWYVASIAQLAFERSSCLPLM